MFVDIFSRRLKSVPACHARKFIKTVITKSQVALVVEVLPKLNERFQDEASAFVLCVRACIDVELYEKTRRVVFLPLEKNDNRLLVDGENENRICQTCLEPERKFLDDLLSKILPLLNLFCCHVNELLEQNGTRKDNLKMGFCFNAATANSYFSFNSYNCLPRVLNVENVEKNVKLDLVASETSSSLNNLNSNDSCKRALIGNFLPYMETCNLRQSMKSGNRQYQESHLKLAIVNSYTKKTKLVCNLKPELNKILFNKVQNFLKELLAMGGIRMLRHKETKFLALKASPKESKLRALFGTAKPADDDKHRLKSSSSQKIGQDFSNCSHRVNFAAKLLKFFLSIAESTDDLKRKITRKSKIIEDYVSSDPVKVYYLVNEIKEMAAASNKQCGLCHQCIRQNKYFEQRRFGILRNCDHIFCYPCIRNYADPRRERVPFRDPVQCPVCGIVSLTLAASSRWIEEPEEKAEFFKKFDQNVETICLYPMRYRTLSGKIRLQESSASRFPNVP